MAAAGAAQGDAARDRARAAVVARRAGNRHLAGHAGAGAQRDLRHRLALGLPRHAAPPAAILPARRGRGGKSQPDGAAGHPAARAVRAGQPDAAPPAGRRLRRRRLPQRAGLLRAAARARSRKPTSRPPCGPAASCCWARPTRLPTAGASRRSGATAPSSTASATERHGKRPLLRYELDGLRARRPGLRPARRPCRTSPCPPAR